MSIVLESDEAGKYYSMWKLPSMRIAVSGSSVYSLKEAYTLNQLLTFDDLDVVSHLEADGDSRIHVEMNHMLLRW